MLKKIRKGVISDGVRNSAVASQPCPSGHITRALRLRFTSPKPPSAASQSPGTLCGIH